MDKDELMEFLSENLRVELNLNNDKMFESTLIVQLKLGEEELSTASVGLPFEWRKW